MKEERISAPNSISYDEELTMKLTKNIRRYDEELTVKLTKNLIRVYETTSRFRRPVWSPLNLY